MQLLDELQLVIFAALGFGSWGFVEYLVHGFLSHRWRTFVSPLHWGHHENPHAVFTSPVAWIPSALLLFGALAWIFGPAPAGAGVGGLLVGFARYERRHWRLHFREPRNPREETLRRHHLAHHYRQAQGYYGVTTRRWDRVFGSFPETWQEDYAAVAATPLLPGRSNFRDSWNPRLAWRRFKEARRIAVP